MAPERIHPTTLAIIAILVLITQIMASSALASPTNGAVKTSAISKQPVLFSETPMEKTYDKLAERLRKNIDAGEDDGEQYWVAIAGGPGSGKTTTATEVADRLNQYYSSEGEEKCVVLPMDGFHYSKDRLKEMDPPEGKNFMARRGAPWTMDAELCYELLSDAKQNKQGQLPTYSRELSDPIPGGVTLQPHHRIVLVEGLYLLLRDDPRWEPLQKLWDETWLIRCPSRENQRERLIVRSLENWSDLKVEAWGSGREGAEKKADATDVLNMDIVAESEKYAEVIIESR